MKIVSCGKYKCPYCGTVVELTKNDIQIWDDVTYCELPMTESHRLPLNSSPDHAIRNDRNDI